MELKNQFKNIKRNIFFISVEKFRKFIWMYFIEENIFLRVQNETM